MSQKGDNPSDFYQNVERFFIKYAGIYSIVFFLHSK